MMNLTFPAVRFLTVLSVFLCVNCSPGPPQRSKSQQELSTPVSNSGIEGVDTVTRSSAYDVRKADISFTLGEELREVSGLAYVDSGQFLMIEDEDGIVFTWDEKEGKVVRQQPFAKNGDYEGIELVGDQIYVVKHTGTLFKMKKSETDSLVSTKFGNFLKGDHDVEGLGYLPTEKLLLLACKEPLLVNGSYQKQFRAIYAFDLDSMKLREEPWLTLDMLTLRKELEGMTGIYKHHKVLEDFVIDKKKSLAPSGIAIHPINGDIYLLSHRSKLLLVLNPQGNLKMAYRLDRDLFEQPEGICFKPNGDLYISNEGEERAPTLLGFTYRP